MKEERKKELKKKYSIMYIDKGSYENGFLDCLDQIDRGMLKSGN